MIRAATTLGFVFVLLLLAIALTGCAPRVVIRTLYVDGMERCGPMCAPFEVRFASEDDEYRFCACADGTKARAEKIPVGDESR